MLKLSRNIEPRANEITIAAAKAYVTEVIDRAPVDTGLTVSSWKVGLNYRPTGTRLFVPGKLGSTATANKNAVKEVVLPQIERRVTGQTITIVNATPYLGFINDGDYERTIDAAFKAAVDAVKQRKLL